MKATICTTSYNYLPFLDNPLEFLDLGVDACFLDLDVDACFLDLDVETCFFDFCGDDGSSLGCFAALLNEL